MLVDKKEYIMWTKLSQERRWGERYSSTYVQTSGYKYAGGGDLLIQGVDWIGSR